MPVEDRDSTYTHEIGECDGAGLAKSCVTRSATRCASPSLSAASTERICACFSSAARRSCSVHSGAATPISCISAGVHLRASSEQSTVMHPTGTPSASRSGTAIAVPLGSPAAALLRLMVSRRAMALAAISPTTPLRWSSRLSAAASAPARTSKTDGPVEGAELALTSSVGDGLACR
eukprot:310852-Pleurochrysis_carterae.AAC.1